jgi:type II secretory pathway component GspD/PulD (secretin)
MSSRRFRGLCFLFLTLVAVTLGVANERAFSLRLPLEMRLKKRIAIDFENTPLAEVIETLRKSADIDIVIDESALDEADISRETPVSMTFEHIKVKSALKLILHQIRFDYMIRGESVVITTRDDPELAGSFVSLAYPVADLMGTPWSDVPSDGPTTEAKVIDLIKRVIDPSSWKLAGGQGTIRYSERTLSIVVYQSRERQEQIQELLVSLRRLQDERPALTPPAAR